MTKIRNPLSPSPSPSSYQSITHKGTKLRISGEDGGGTVTKVINNHWFFCSLIISFSSCLSVEKGEGGVLLELIKVLVNCFIF